MIIMVEADFHLPTRVTDAGMSSVLEAASVLQRGGLVAFPTETVYGLGADATNPLAVAKLFAAKGRPSFNPLISHVIDQSAAESLGNFNTHAKILARAFWPGPLTIVVPKLSDCNVCDLALSGLQTIAIRVPFHPVSRALIEALSGPIVAPSANLSGRVSPTRSEHVFHDLFGRIDQIIEGGSAEIGVESTIVSCFNDVVQILRPGGVSTDSIHAIVGGALTHKSNRIFDAGAPLAPGMLASHYAPNARVRLNADVISDGEALLGFGKSGTKNAHKAQKQLNLSPSANLLEAAANLFQYLRILDTPEINMIAVSPIPNVGIGEAINDRLQRAASPR